MLPEFAQTTGFILVHVPGPDFNWAAERITASYNRAAAQTEEQPVILLGVLASGILPHIFSAFNNMSQLQQVGRIY